jgi:hypothetical protein
MLSLQNILATPSLKHFPNLYPPAQIFAGLFQKLSLEEKEINTVLLFSHFSALNMLLPRFVGSTYIFVLKDMSELFSLCN